MKKNNFDEKSIKLNQLKALVAIYSIRKQIYSIVKEVLFACNGKVLNCRIAQAVEIESKKQLAGLVETISCKVTRDEFKNCAYNLSVRFSSKAGKYAESEYCWSDVGCNDVYITIPVSSTQTPRLDVSLVKMSEFGKYDEVYLQEYQDAVCNFNKYYNKNKKIMSIIESYKQEQPKCLQLHDLRWFNTTYFRY